MKAIIISVGTELLLGQINNTNAKYICRRLGELGIDVYFITCVGDNPKRLKQVLSFSEDTSDIIILTGGLGPTMDDITKETVCDFLGLSLIMHSESLANIKKYFKKLGREIKESNYKQAMFPKEAYVMSNVVGTAPGCIINKKGKTYILLPGPPKEMEKMFENSVYKYFLEKRELTLVSKTLKVFGIGESTAEDIIKDIVIRQTNPTIAPLASSSEVSFRITAKAKNEFKCNELINKIENKINNKLGNYIYGSDNDSLESIIVEILIKKKLTISTAESCTGGLLANKITDVAGASNIFKRGFITYSDDAKINILGVSKELIEKYTAVSVEVAKAMAMGALRISKANIAVSTTGFAGPDGEQVGLIFICITDGKINRVRELKLTGSRKKIKMMTAKHCLNEIRLFLYSQRGDGR